MKHLAKSKSPQIRQELAENSGELANELVTFFAAFFYLKDLWQAEKFFDQASEQNGSLKARVLYDLMHKTLYKYSNNNLHTLFY